MYKNLTPVFSNTLCIRSTDMYKTDVETSTVEKPNYENLMIKESSSKIMGFITYMITIKETSTLLAIK